MVTPTFFAELAGVAGVAGADEGGRVHRHQLARAAVLAGSVVTGVCRHRATRVTGLSSVL